MSENFRLYRKIGFRNTFYTNCINVIINSIGPSIILRSIFHEIRLLADDSHDISYLIFVKLGKLSQRLSSAAVVLDALRVIKYKLFKALNNFTFYFHKT